LKSRSECFFEPRRVAHLGTGPGAAVSVHGMFRPNLADLRQVSRDLVISASYDALTSPVRAHCVANALTQSGTATAETHFRDERDAEDAVQQPYASSSGRSASSAGSITKEPRADHADANQVELRDGPPETRHACRAQRGWSRSRR